MSRQKLPGRRENETHKIYVHGGRNPYHFAFGFDENGKVKELFINHPVDGDVPDTMDALAKLISVAMQSGVSVVDIVYSLRFFPDNNFPGIIRNLFQNYLSDEEKEELSLRVGVGCVPPKL